MSQISDVKGAAARLEIIADKLVAIGATSTIAQADLIREIARELRTFQAAIDRLPKAEAGAKVVAASDAFVIEDRAENVVFKLATILMVLRGTSPDSMSLGRPGQPCVRLVFSGAEANQNVTFDDVETRDLFFRDICAALGATPLTGRAKL